MNDMPEAQLRQFQDALRVLESALLKFLGPEPTLRVFPSTHEPISDKGPMKRKRRKTVPTV